MSQNEKNVGPDLTGVKSVGDSASTPPAQPAANVPAGVNPGAPVTTSPGIQVDNTPSTPAPATKPAEATGAQGAAKPKEQATPAATVKAGSPEAADQTRHATPAAPATPATPTAPATPAQAATQATPAAPTVPGAFGNAAVPATPVQGASPTPAPAAPKAEDTAVVKVNSYIPGGLSKDVVNPIPNPAQSDQNFPFSAGQKMHEVAQYQNFFTFPLDTYYNIFDAIYYFSQEKNRNRYTYEQQQLIISRIVRAAKDFGIPIEGIRDKLTL